MRLPLREIARRADELKHKLGASPRAARLSAEILDGESVIGGGAAPAAKLPTRVLALTSEGLSADEFAARLRRNDPPVVARVEEGRVVLDLRTVFPEQDAAVLEALLSSTPS